MDYIRKVSVSHFRPLIVGDHAELLAGEPYNVMVDMIDPSSVAVLNLDLDQIDSVVASMADFDALFTPSPA